MQAANRPIVVRRARPTGLGEVAGQPAAQDGADAGAEVDEGHEAGALQRVLAALALQVGRQPEQEEPPDRVGQHLGHQEGPDLAVAQQCRPAQAQGLLAGRLASTDVGQLVRRQPGVLFRRMKAPLPEHQPQQAGRADRHERRLPTEGEGQPHRHRRRDDAQRRAGVEQAGRERAFLLREPHRHGLDGRREVGRLGHAEQEAHEDEAQHRRDQAMRGRCQRPQHQREPEAALDAEAVDGRADQWREGGVGGREGEGDPAVVGIGQRQAAGLEGLLQAGLEDRQRVAVDVVDRRRRKQQGADPPALAAGGRGGSVNHHARRPAVLVALAIWARVNPCRGSDATMVPSAWLFKTLSP
jgi:hypothetical protein